MKPFDYIVPVTLQEAVAALDGDREGARPIAGGQSLLLEMKERRRTPSRLVSVSALPELSHMGHDDDGELVIGAGTSYATLCESQLPGWHAVVADVAGDLADRPVRTMGTIGGALCQADPRFDMPALVIGLDARLELISMEGLRTAPASELFPAGGGIDLRPAEILVAVHLPALEHFTAVAFEKVRHRTFDAAVASAVCALRLGDDGAVVQARLTVGAIAPAPVVLERASAALTGRVPGEAEISAACARATEALDEAVAADSRQQRYQHELVAVVVRRAITQALNQSRS